MRRKQRSVSALRTTAGREDSPAADSIEPPLIPPPGTTYIIVSAPPVAYTMQAAAAACGLSVSTLRAAVIKGTLSARWVGRKPIIRHEDLVEWVDELSQDDPAELP